MWWPIFAALALGGCAQVFGIEDTTGIDAPPDSAPRPDGPACAGGSVDPSTGACYVFVGTSTIRRM